MPVACCEVRARSVVSGKGVHHVDSDMMDQPSPHPRPTRGGAKEGLQGSTPAAQWPHARHVWEPAALTALGVAGRPLLVPGRLASGMAGARVGCCGVVGLMAGLKVQPCSTSSSRSLLASSYLQGHITSFGEKVESGCQRHAVSRM